MRLGVVKTKQKGLKWIGVGQSGSEWVRVDQSGSEWVRVGQSGSEWVRVGQSGSEHGLVLPSFFSLPVFTPNNCCQTKKCPSFTITTYVLTLIM